jgi:long-chain acyl-CoA synthetase
MPSLPDLIRESAECYGGHPAVIIEGKRFSHAEIDLLSDKAAAGLAAKGVLKGDRVALYCLNSAEFAIAYVGIIKAGAVVVPINLMQKPAEVAFVLNDSAAKGLIYHSKFKENAHQQLGSIPSLEFSVCIGEENSTSSLKWGEFIQNEQQVPAVQFEPDDDLVAILYTSGTTGRPKGAMLTHTNLVANTQSVVKAMRWQAGEDRVLLVLPMFHAFAATVGMLTPLTCGCAFIPLPKFEPEQVARVVKETQTTIFLAVPSMYNVLLRIKEEHVTCFKSIRFAVSGGASMPLEVMRQFEEKFRKKIYEGDGPTECSPVTCVNPIGGLTKPGTVGLPVPGVEMAIVDDSGKVLPIGEVGEIAVHGASVMKGYWNLPEETAASFVGEWFLTGDLGTEDEDGYFSIVDRKKDMVIVNGMNVYSRIIEEVLYLYKPIVEAAVIGEPDRLHGENVVAYVVVDDNKATSVAAVRGWCRDHLGHYEVPKKIFIVDELPKNAAGKILKRELRRQGEIERGIDIKG